MMQEVGNDDTNGESTFEFVERKLEDMHLSASSPADHQQSAGSSTDNKQELSSTYVLSGHHVTSAPIQSFISPIPSSELSHVPPPAVVPTILVPTTNIDDSASSKPAISGPYYSTSVTPLQRLPAAAMPSMYTMPAPPPEQSSNPPQSIYNPNDYGVSSTALDLPLMPGGYDYGYDTQKQMYQGQNESTSGSGMWGWIKGTVSGNDFLNKFAEKAKNSVDTMITTLDPQMKQYIYSGGDIDIIVTSLQDNKIAPVWEAFQSVFGRAKVSGLDAQNAIAAQPVGYAAGLKGAENRISYLRQSGLVRENQTVVAVENFLVELTPERWFDIGCLVLDDPRIGPPLHVYTQSVPIPIDYINALQEETRNDYPLRWSGFAVTIGEVISRSLQVPHTEWHEAVGGITRKEMVFAAAKSLATLYKQRCYNYNVQST